MTEERYYRLNEIIGDRDKGIPPIIPVSASTFYARVKAGVWPKPVKLSHRIAMWRKSDIDKLMQSFSNPEAAQ